MSQEELEEAWGRILGDFADLLREGSGGWRFLLLFSKGDLEVRAVAWGLPSYNGEEPCTECRANRSDKPFTDLSATALWRPSSGLTLAQYVGRAREPLHHCAVV